MRRQVTPPLTPPLPLRTLRLVLCAAFALVAATKTAAATEPSEYFAAHVLAFPQEGGPCEQHEGSVAVPRIGGSPACFTIGDTTELYLCDARGHVLIANCRKTDCTDCDVPALNQYGYVDGKCQANGWLRADCSTVPVAEDRFRSEEERSSL